MQRLVPVSKNVQTILLNCSKVSSRLNYSKCAASLPAQLSVLCEKRLIENNSNLLNKRVNLLNNNNYNDKTMIGKRFYSSSKYPDHIDIRLPALSPTMEQGTIAKWCVAEGDSVAEGDLIAEIETDKATMGLESSEDGFVAKILVEEKTKDIPLRTLLCIMVRDKDEIAAFADYKPSDDVGGNVPDVTPPPPQQPPKQEAPKPKPTPPPPPPPAPTQNKPQKSAPSQNKSSRVFASPLAKKLAAERNIDLSLVNGTGPDNEIRVNDVMNYTADTPSRAPSSSSSTSSSDNYQDVDLNNFRKITAKRLLESKQTIPHYYLTIDFELDNALKVRKDLNEQLAKDNLKVSVTDIVIKAAACACKKVPEANSAWMDTFIRQYNNVDVNVAVATDNGLITPIVFDADKKGLTSISFDVNSLAQKARTNKLQPHEFQGGTFTVSNLGMFGVKNFSAVINPPQSCILAVGGAEKRLIPSDSGSREATIMTVTLSCDHRVVDGAVGAKWLQHFKSYMENPAAMLL